MNRKGTGIGSASLILIFSVLCLTVFSLLTLAMANREKALSEKLKSSVESYYSADSAATEIAAALRQSAANGQTPSEIDGVAIESDGTGKYTYSCPMDGRRSIFVELKIENGEIKILSWYETNIVNWTPDENLNVWIGE